MGGRPEYPNGASRTLNPKVDGLRVVAIIGLRESFAQLLRSCCSGCKYHLNACKCFCGCGVAVTRDPTQKVFMISRALVRHSCTSYSKHLRQGTLSRVLKDHLCKARGAFRGQLHRLLHALVNQYVRKRLNDIVTSDASPAALAACACCHNGPRSVSLRVTKIGAVPLYKQCLAETVRKAS